MHLRSAGEAVAKDARLEALSAVEKATNANRRTHLSSLSPGESGVDLRSLAACSTFQPTLLKVPAYTPWVARWLHNLCLAVQPRSCWQLSFRKMLFLKQPRLPLTVAQRKELVASTVVGTTMLCGRCLLLSHCPD